VTRRTTTSNRKGGKIVGVPFRQQKTAWQEFGRKMSIREEQKDKRRGKKLGVPVPQEEQLDGWTGRKDLGGEELSQS